MTETPTERAAMVHYVQEWFQSTGQAARASEATWRDPSNRRWVERKIASMAAALAEYEAAKAEVSAASLREKACEDLDRALANGCDPATAVDIFVEDMAEPDAPQPRKEGA